MPMPLANLSRQIRKNAWQLQKVCFSMMFLNISRFYASKYYFTLMSILFLFTVPTTVLNGAMFELQYKRIQVTMVIVHAQIYKDPADMKTWSGHTKLVSLLTSPQTFAVTCYKIIGKRITMEIICKYSRYHMICIL